jgi:hypothetical protein
VGWLAVVALRQRKCDTLTLARKTEAEGANTNQVESYFSRLRRIVTGQHHGVSPKYLHQYSAHAAWLEHHRRRSNGENVYATVANAMAHPVSRNRKGYWQRAAR